ncbi:ASF1_like histone chaperone domain-containing protein [Hexamita inflata]|uniref:ASF1 like histone chaperone domain-containing protein n=1 Tax=Hexamita inflata TaxID=28002 RepID=A0AA86UG32_9EUKA|nr:ASF1 like histone chaperone domain-containing protein [Hexamita inflata]CAI9949797.1 ASF1 like histone chaperone domain-containing protein [Hexamita inflata]
MAQLEEIQIFKKPIIEFENQKNSYECAFLAPLKICVKLETTAALDTPLTFQFIYTDGDNDKILKDIELNSPQPKKQKFNVELSFENLVKTIGQALKPQCILMDVSYKGEKVARCPFFIGAWDSTHQYVVAEDEDDLEEFEEMEEEEFEEGEEGEEMWEEEEIGEEEMKQLQAEAEAQEKQEGEAQKEGLSYEELDKIEANAETLKNFMKAVTAKASEGVYRKPVEKLNE